MIEPSPSAPEPDLLPDLDDTGNYLEDDPPERLWLRRIMKAVYILIVILVIAGLITMFFPWDRVDIPFDPPFRFPERM